MILSTGFKIGILDNLKRLLNNYNKKQKLSNSKNFPTN